MWITPSEETREVCGTRYINSQVEEEKVEVCKQLMDFFTVCRETRSERRKSRKREEGGQNLFSSLCQHFWESSGGLRSLFKRLKSLWNHFVLWEIYNVQSVQQQHESRNIQVLFTFCQRFDQGHQTRPLPTRTDWSLRVLVYVRKLHPNSCSSCSEQTEQQVPPQSAPSPAVDLLGYFTTSVIYEGVCGTFGGCRPAQPLALWWSYRAERTRNCWYSGENQQPGHHSNVTSQCPCKPQIRIFKRFTCLVKVSKNVIYHGSYYIFIFVICSWWPQLETVSSSDSATENLILLTGSLVFCSSSVWSEHK